jgi:hypothetical protein
VQDITRKKTKDGFVKRRRQPQAVSGRRIIFFLISGIIFFILLSSVINLGHKYIAIRGKLSELKKEQLDIERKQLALDEQNQFLSTKEGQERLLREKYNLVKPGEGVIVVTEPQSGDMNDKDRRSIIGNIWHSILRALGFEKQS